MNRYRGLYRTIRVAVVATCLTTVAAAQELDSEREKHEKVADVLTALDAQPGRRIADVGAGDGFYTERIARIVGPSGRVTAVDIQSKALDKLQARLDRAGIRNVDVVLGREDDPRLPTNSFDAVLIYNAYHEMTAHEAVLKAIHSALRPGAKLVVVEALRDQRRASTRAEQVREHNISDEIVAKEMVASGFDILTRRPDFLRLTDPQDPGGFWLLVATKRGE